MAVEYVLDGAQIASLEDFWRVMGEAINGPGGFFGRSLDGFADCLRGGFGTPADDDFRVVWRDHQTSRERLGYRETVRQLELRFSKCHPANRPTVANDLAMARQLHGPTVFDWIVGIFSDEAPGVLQLR